jgi:DNA-binding transcriptional ArsR family regulator
MALLNGETACVCDLAWIVGRDERLVSHHVRLLKASGLASSTRDGKMVMYELTARGRSLLTAVAAQELRAT